MDDPGTLAAPAKPGERQRSVNLRAILNGVFDVLRSVLRSGCQWRLLPRAYDPWSTMYAYYRVLSRLAHR